MSPLLKVLLWLALPVAVCVWAVAHGQMPPHISTTRSAIFYIGRTGRCNDQDCEWRD